MGTGDNDSSSEYKSECSDTSKNKSSYFVRSTKAFVASNNSNENWNNNIDNDNFSDDRVIVDSGAAVSMFRDASNFVKSFKDREVHVRGVAGGDFGYIGVLKPNNLKLKMGVLFESLVPAALVSTSQLSKSGGWEVTLKDSNSRMKSGDTTIPIDDTGELPVVSPRFVCSCFR